MVNSVADRIRRIREWRDAMRDQTHPGGLVDPGHWHDVNLLLNEIDRLSALLDQHDDEGTE